MSSDSFVLPGDAVPATGPTLKLGPGLLKLPDKASSSGGGVIATKAGTLHHDAKRIKWWVETNARRYVPAAQEGVIGVVAHKAGEGYRIDIGSAHSASLDGLAFEGASKRNRPLLKVGALVYARVCLAHKDMEPELQCFDAQTRKSEGFGELKGGFMQKCSLGTCRALLDPTHWLLPMLGSRFPLEVVVGVNGRVWFKTPAAPQTIAVARCIALLDDRTETGAGEMKMFLDTLDT